MTAHGVLIETVKRGLTLSVRGEQLAVTPERLLTLDFADMLRAHKQELLRLLALTFLIIQSDVLNEIVFFVPDEETRAALVASGAKHWSIYTRSELTVLVERRVNPDELRLLHEAKGRFNGTVTP
jgi:hypothetical protein